MRFLCPQCRTILSGNPGVEIECSLCGEKVTAPGNHFSTNAVIGDFAIVRELGRGGVGVIYLARQISLDRPVALKILQSKFADNPEFVESFIREARVAAKLSHPNIVQAYAVGEDDGLFYFAMEYIDGQTMKQVLKKEGKINARRAAEIICEIADALDFAWTERKLVHQDIKPDNIMLTRRGRAKLADLGLARLAGSDAGMNDDDEVMGTPQYISPEQLTGMPTDVRSDIYSLGATFFHFVTGRFPYIGHDGNEIARQHVEGTLTPPRQLNPEIPEEINRIIVKMMAKDIKQRYQSAAELHDDLRRFLDGSGAAVMPKLTIPTTTTSFVPKLTIPATSTTFTPTISTPISTVPAQEPTEAKNIVPVVPKVLAVPVVSAVQKQPPEPEKAAEPEKAPEPEKATEPEKAAEPPAPVIKKVFFTKRKIRVALLTLAIVVVVAGGIGGGLFWIIRTNRVPEKLRPIEARLLALLQYERQDGKLVRLTHSIPAPSPEKEDAPPPPRPLPPPEPPKPVTRQAYLEGVNDLVEAVRNQIEEKRFLERVDRFFKRFDQPRTPAELNAQRRLAQVFGRIDERLRVSPARRSARQAELDAIDAKRKTEENRRREEEERAERRHRDEAAAAAEAKRVAAEAAEQERINRENERAGLERVRNSANEIRRDLFAAFMQSLRSGDETAWIRAAEQANNRLQQLFTANSQEKSVKDSVANDLWQLSDSWKKIDPYRKLFTDKSRLCQIQIEIAGGELVRAEKFRNGKLLTTPDGKKTIVLDMCDTATRHAFTRRAERRFKMANMDYYLLLVSGNYQMAMKLKKQPSGYLRQNLPAMLTAYFSSLSDAERAALEPTYGSLKEFRKGNR